MHIPIPKLALTFSVALALIVPIATSSQAAVRPPLTANADQGQATVSLDAIASYFAEQDARMTASLPALGSPSPSSAKSSATSSASDSGTDVTGLLLASFGESGNTVIDSHTTVTGVRANGADVLADVRYDWTLRDANGNTFEASTSDIHRLAVTSSGRVRSQRFEPDRTLTPSGPQIPREARPASTSRTEAATTSHKAASEATSPTSTARVRATATPPMGYLNYTAMRTYALTWTDTAHANSMNPAYPEFNNNCANFVSQTLRAGGWKYRNGLVPSNLTYWSPNLTGPAGASYTWGGAAHLYTFGLRTAKLTQVGNIWNTATGDLLFTDWDPTNRPDGKIDHAMVITGRDANGPLVTQKSNNRHNLPMATYLAIVKSQGKTTVTWYGLIA